MIDEARPDASPAIAPTPPAGAQAADPAADPRSGRQSAWRIFLRNPAGVAGLLILLIMAGLALAAPYVYAEGPLAMGAMPFIWPGEGLAYPLGTDALGRDVAAGVAWGARVTMLVGLSATFFGVSAGVIIGAVAGYFGGRADMMLSKLIEFFQTPPSFVLLMVVVAIAQPSVSSIILAIALVTWPTVARLVRAEFRSLREKDFVLAARSLGFGHARIIFGEILPNALPAIIVTASLLVAQSILMESALSFMSLGDPNLVTWGSMIGSGREHLFTAWFLSAVPGVAIVLTVLSLNLIGDGLNDALNPRSE
ncbi:MAG: ABC transporter permease [Rhizobiaceae bacterium]|nr:ABC transporter permease [Rhizobiaceae bacterium]